MPLYDARNATKHTRKSKICAKNAALGQEPEEKKKSHLLNRSNPST